MARQIRIEYADAADHVMERGTGDESRVTQATHPVKRHVGCEAKRLKKRLEWEYASSESATA